MRKSLGIWVLTLAQVVILAHAIVPHHHHHQQRCVCVERNHQESGNAAHNDDNSEPCVISRTAVTLTYRAFNERYYEWVAVLIPTYLARPALPVARMGYRAHDVALPYEFTIFSYSLRAPPYLM